MAESRRIAMRRATGATRGRAGGAQAEHQPRGTMTVTTTEPERPVLHLELAPRRVRWTADTHDNEHDGGRTSKSCCIYHRPRRFDESSTESSADESDDHESSSSSDEEGSDGEGRCDGGGGEAEGGTGKGSRARRRGRRRRHRHGDDGADEKNDGSSSSDGGQVRRPVRRQMPADGFDTYAALEN